MGNTGVSKDRKKANHVHYQLKDPAGTVIDPSAYWDQRGPVQPNLAPPAYLGEHLRYLRGLGATSSKAAPMDASITGPFGTGMQFMPGSATSSRPLYETRSFVPLSDEVTSPRNVRRLVRVTGPTAASLADITTAPVAQLNNSSRSVSFVRRSFWGLDLIADGERTARSLPGCAAPARDQAIRDRQRPADAGLALSAADLGFSEPAGCDWQRRMDRLEAQACEMEMIEIGCGAFSKRPRPDLVRKCRCPILNSTSMFQPGWAEAAPAFSGKHRVRSASASQRSRYTAAWRWK